MLVCIFGKRGAGKTTTIRGALPQCQGPVVVADILGNYTQAKNEKGEKIEPFYQEFDDLSEAIRKIGDWCKNPDEKNKIFIVRANDPNTTVDFLSSTLWECRRGTLVLDEADAFSLENAPCFDYLVRYGRNRNIDLLTGCRRPAEISRNITAGANRVYAFRTQEPRDIEYFEKTVFGERAERLMEVEPYHGLFIDYDDLTVGEFKIDQSGNLFSLSQESVK